MLLDSGIVLNGNTIGHGIINQGWGYTYNPRREPNATLRRSGIRGQRRIQAGEICGQRRFRAVIGGIGRARGRRLEAVFGG